MGIARFDWASGAFRLTQQRNDDDLRRPQHDARSLRARGVAITGAIASGKTTLASALAERIGARYLSSDAIRQELYGDRDGNPDRVFRLMEERLQSAFDEGIPAVLDSTGMSYRFRRILERYRKQFVHVHLAVRDPRIFEARETARTDRLPLPRTVYNRSKSIRFPRRPDIIIETDAFTPQQVRDTALLAVLSS